MTSARLIRKCWPLIRRLTLAWASGLLVVSCANIDAGLGGKSSNAGKTDAAQTSDAVLAVSAAADLPACDGTRNGQLAYISSTRSFSSCSSGHWSVLEVGGGSPTQAAQSLYQTYRRSVFRVTTVCQKKVPYPSTCPNADKSASPPGSLTSFLGTAFLCGSQTACSNRHVVSCLPAECYDFKSTAMQMPAERSGSTVEGGKGVAPFFTASTPTPFRAHPSGVDLVKFSVGVAAADLPVLPIAEQATKGRLSGLEEVLSLSFPLGFEDEYADLGRVNAPTIGECDTAGGVSGYGCLSQLYDFSTTNNTDHGSSGSPLFDVASGKVIGVTSAGTQGENANYTWAVDAHRLSEIP